MRLALASLLIAPTLTACLDGASGDLDNPVDPQIIGGVADSGDPAVGMLRAIHTFVGTNPTSYGGCTATMIASNVGITAAHCADGVFYDISFSSNPERFGLIAQGEYVPAQVIVHPSYTGDPTVGHDVAIVFLGGFAPGTPKTRAATPDAGGVVRAVGYGMDQFGNDGTGSGIKRYVDMPVLGVADHEIVAGVDGVSTCHGDSGGPILVGDQIVGTVSYGDSVDCHGSGHYMRLDDNLDFIHRYVPNF